MSKKYSKAGAKIAAALKGRKRPAEVGAKISATYAAKRTPEVLAERLANKKPRDQITADYREGHRKQLRAAGRKYYRHNAKKHKDRVLRKRYGITLEDYNRKVLEQENRCAICGQEETSIQKSSGKVRPLSVDHNHETGQVRDLLCGRCNAVLSQVENFNELIENMEAYLLRWDAASTS